MENPPDSTVRLIEIGFVESDRSHSSYGTGRVDIGSGKGCVFIVHLRRRAT